MQARISLDHPQLVNGVRWRVAAQPRRQPRRSLSPIYSTDGVRQRVAKQYIKSRRYQPPVSQSIVTQPVLPYRKPTFDQMLPSGPTSAPTNAHQRQVHTVVMDSMVRARGQRSSLKLASRSKKSFASHARKTINPVIRLVKNLRLDSAAIDAPLSRMKFHKLRFGQFNFGKTGIYAMAMAVFGFGMWVAIDGYMVNRQVEQDVLSITTGSGSSSIDRDVPGEPVAEGDDSISSVSEVEPTATQVGNYTVLPSSARILRIPKLGVSSRVRTVGLKSNGAVGTPSNIYDTGWYSGSSKFDEAGGAAFLVGHVHGYTSPGVFYELDKLVAGDTITVERGDGEMMYFKVVTKQSYLTGETDMIKAMTSVNPEKFGLNLMTCSGNYDRASESYTERLLIRAEQI